jgi:nicotinate-nucleotide adenylyltransferase
VAGLRLGIFGGTFDPPHLGHLILAQEACEQLKLERVLWVLTPLPPHKTGQYILPLADRLDLLQACLADNPLFELSRVDIERKPPHYAVDTMRILHKRQPQDELIYLLGGDSLDDLPGWHDAQSFVQACDEIGVMLRPGRSLDLTALELELPGLSARIRFLQTPLIEISSTELRKRIANGRPFRYYLPDAVYAMIVERGLFRVKTPA